MWLLERRLLISPERQGSKNGEQSSSTAPARSGVGASDPTPAPVLRNGMRPAGEDPFLKGGRETGVGDAPLQILGQEALEGTWAHWVRGDIHPEG